MHSLTELIAFNEREKAREMPFFGQELLLSAAEEGPLTTPAYRAALAKCRALARAQGIDLVMQQFRLDALVAPTGGPAWTTDLVNGDHFTGASSTPAAVAGYPSITVPAGQAFGLPVGISFIGSGRGRKPKLIALAYAYEQATKRRRPPQVQTESSRVKVSSPVPRSGRDWTVPDQRLEHLERLGTRTSRAARTARCAAHPARCCCRRSPSDSRLR